MAAFWTMITCALLITLVGLWQTSVRFYSWRKGRRSLAAPLVLADRLWQERASFLLRPNPNNNENGFVVPATLFAAKRYRLYFLLDLDALCFPQPFPLWLQKGALFRVEITGESALYIAEVRGCGVHFCKEGCLLKTTRPFWAARIQRRQHVRVNVSLPITIVPMEEASTTCHSAKQPNESLLQSASAHLCNLSAGGFCAELHRECSPEMAARFVQLLAPGTTWVVRLPIVELESARLSARVLTSDRVLMRCGMGARITAEFLSQPPWVQEALMRFVFQKQREELKKRYLGQDN